MNLSKASSFSLHELSPSNMFLTQIEGGQNPEQGSRLNGPKFYPVDDGKRPSGPKSEYLLDQPQTILQQASNPFAKLMVGHDEKLLTMRLDFTNRDVRDAMATLQLTRADLTLSPYTHFAEKLISEDIQMMKYNCHVFQVCRK